MSLNVFRIGLAIGGFVVAVVAIALEDHRMAWAAIALLIGSLVVRLLQRRRPM